MTESWTKCPECGIEYPAPSPHDEWDIDRHNSPIYDGCFTLWARARGIELKRRLVVDPRGSKGGWVKDRFFRNE